MTEFQWWQVMIGIASMGVTVGLAIFGRGFKYWADMIDKMGDRMDSRLHSMSTENLEKWDKVEARMREATISQHEHNILMERRVSRLEAADKQRERREDSTH